MSELLRRKELLKKIQSQKNGFIKPRFLKENNIYRGAQGIYIDQTLTKNIDPKGITVSILHTGRHYPDELSDDGLIYHYPQTLFCHFFLYMYSLLQLLHILILSIPLK